MIPLLGHTEGYKMNLFGQSETRHLEFDVIRIDSWKYETRSVNCE